ncbi:unnamed protein product [Mytilus coruscus]|uniref:Uncharacterized protein n=1 Tax=Mytilus coruscus TaxID=42192 RepID=A0A6J8EP39_MYTCO|nr:unnamed protein product [Mytilus coruscus]
MNQTMNYECVDTLLHTNQTVCSRNVTAVILIEDFNEISVSEISMWKTENFIAHRDLEKGHNIREVIPVDENRVEKSSDSKEVKQGKTTVEDNIVSPDTNIDILLLTDTFGSLQLADLQSPKPEKSNDIDARKEKISVYETPNLPNDVDRTSDEYSKSERYLKAMKHTDIVVLHVEDNICLKETNNVENMDSAESLQNFKDHLKTLADEWGYNHIKINFFEDVFVWCNHNNKISFTDVMNKCGMIFFYMSKNFLPGKLRRYGLSESGVKFALKYLNDFPKVKTVRVCEQCKLYEKGFEIHLDYCKYKKSKDVDLYESTLREIFEKL